MRLDKGLIGRLPTYAGDVYSDGELLVEDLSV